jgi:hypothetical protein
MALGFGALATRASAINNTAVGVQSLFSDTLGNYDTAAGVQALFSNTTGYYNTANGARSLYSNTSGIWNTASGFNALYANTTGKLNTGVGVNAMFTNTTGIYNTAVGVSALFYNTTGQNNIALGLNSGYNLTTGNYNIEIGNPGTSGDSNTIRIGTSQTATYIAGIANAGVTGANVVVDATGRLGIATSSARYKKDIRDMGEQSEGLMKLRPVSFKYKTDKAGTTQYGLVAEEVEKVYPELVVYGADGKVQTVRYTMMTAMLLNELQKQARENRQQAEDNRQRSSQIDRQSRQIELLSKRLAQAQASERAEAAQLRALQSSIAQRVAALERTMATRDTSRSLASAGQ